MLSLAGRPLCAQAPAVSTGTRPTQAAGARSAAAVNSASNINPATDADLAQYVGQYRSTSNPDQINAVYLDGGVLYEESERRARQRLVSDALPGSADRFQIASPQAHVVFLRDATGAVSGLKFVLDRDGSTLVEERRFSIAGTRLNHFRQYTRQEAMLPMRDGVRLHAVILRPAHIEPGESLPFLIARTPYGVDDFDSESVNHDKPELAASGYIFVYEDIRGRYGSEGSFVMNRPIVAHNSKNDVDETTDTRDTIDWLLKNVPGNNGRIGVFGLSYDGFLAMMAGIDAHPAVKAISPQAPMTDVWMGDDFFHNGAFRQSYGFDYVQEMEAQKTDARVDMKQDMYDFFLRHVNFAGAVATVPKMSDLPTAKAFLTQPAYTAFWQAMGVEERLGGVEVPTLEVGGYWDQEDMWGTQAEYAALKKHETRSIWCSGPGRAPARRLARQRHRAAALARRAHAHHPQIQERQAEDGRSRPLRIDQRAGRQAARHHRPLPLQCADLGRHRLGQDHAAQLPDRLHRRGRTHHHLRGRRRTAIAAAPCRASGNAAAQSGRPGPDHHARIW